MSKRQTSSRFGALLLSHRLDANLCRKDFARAVGLTDDYIRMIETGQRLPRSETINAAVEPLGLSKEDEALLQIGLALDRLQMDSELPHQVVDILWSMAEPLCESPEAQRRAARPRTVGTPRDPDLRRKSAAYVAHLLETATRRWSGSLRLEMPEYFRLIIEALAADGLTTVDAINTIDPRRWSDDVRERIYLEAHRHPLARGVTVRRIFVVDEKVSEADLRECVAVQRAAGISHVAFIDRREVSLLAEQPEDAVWFGHVRPEHNRLYIGHSDPLDVTRVEFGEVIDDALEMTRYAQQFNLLLRAADGDVQRFLDRRGDPDLLN